ncbi:MAG: CBS domain-containing protein [Clostridiales bacterium]|jgi:CBS domain-containing protein|nr:CBS domain-containing protein [Clostridiales bacterium]
MKVKEIMSKDLASIRSEDSVENAARLMKEYNVGSVPVCNNSQVVGIVTDRDITLRATARGQSAVSNKVSDVMSSNPVVGDPEMDVNEAAGIMSEKQIRRLPIVENNRLVGIVSLGDISTEPSQQRTAGEALKNISDSGFGSM